MKALIFLHVLGAILFMGNIITAAFWKVRAERSGDLAHLHRTAKNVMIADYAFTLPGLFLLLITGISMAHTIGYPLFAGGWLTISLLLFLLAGLIWLAILLPSQQKMIRESRLSIEKGALTGPYKKASRTWDVFGIIASIIPLVILFYMLTKGE